MAGATTLTRLVATLVVAGLFLCVSAQVQAQDGWGLPWGHMIPTEYDRNALPEDPTAGASVVFDRGLITVGPGFKFTFERHRRVQIFRTDAYRFANAEIPYHPSEQIEFIEAHTLTKDGRKVVVDPASMHETQVGDWRKLVFAFPDAGPGCVVEYRYKVHSRKFYYLRPWVFQSDIPTERSELSVKLPEGFEYAAVVNNPDYVHGPDTVEFISLIHDKETKIRQFTWRAHTVPPLVPEPCLASILNHRVLLDFQIVKYEDGNYVRGFIDTWGNLASQVKRVYAPLLKADPSWPKWGTISGDLRLMDQAHERESLARRIYAFVRDSVALSGAAVTVFDSELKSARTIMSHRRGNALEKNLLFVALLRHHGLDAWPVLISRRSHYRFNDLDHRLEQFDHVIVLLDTGTDQVFCEASAPFGWMGYLPPDVQVDAGVVIGRDGDEKIVIELPASPVDKDVVADGLIDIQPDGSASGRLAISLAGQAAYDFMSAVADHDTIGYLHKEWLPGVMARSISIERDAENEWSAVRLTVDFVLPHAADVDGGRMLIRPSFLRELAENPLMASQRRYPISFETPWSEDCRLTWRIPEGYEFTNLPDGRDAKGDGYEFRSSVHAEGNTIVATRFWRVSQRDFSVRRFSELRELFNTVQMSQAGLLMLYREAD